MKVGITFSAFDLFHAGHIKMLEEAKSKCDYLIVGLQLDPSIDRPEKNKPTVMFEKTKHIFIIHEWYKNEYKIWHKKGSNPKILHSIKKY